MIVRGLLMLGGVGLVAFITAHVAALFVEDEEDRGGVRAGFDRVERFHEELRKELTPADLPNLDRMVNQPLRRSHPPD